MVTNNSNGRKPLRLPFEKRKSSSDWGSWIYTHRVGIMSTVIVYLVCTIAFLSYRIVINSSATEMIAIEFEREAEQEKELTPEEIKQKEIELIQQMAFAKAQNKISNEDSKFNSSLSDAKKSNASEIYKEAERVSSELEAGKRAYEQGLREIESTKKQNKKNDTKEENQPPQRENVKGDVFVSYNIESRTDTYLHIPAYQCQFGGMVVVNVTVNRNGRVVAATVDKATSSSDGCITEMAVKSAMASVFNTSGSASDRQKGTITYRFVPQ